MSASGSNTNNGRTVGDTVRVRRNKDVVIAGKIVEDYEAFLLASDVLGRDWARPHRWAVALETGVLVFVDDVDLVA